MTVFIILYCFQYDITHILIAETFLLLVLKNCMAMPYVYFNSKCIALQKVNIAFCKNARIVQMFHLRIKNRQQDDKNTHLFIVWINLGPNFRNHHHFVKWKY